MGLAFSSSQLLPIFFLGTFLLLIFFTCWLVFIYRRGLSVSCGCFGANSSLVNKMDIIRNIIFMGITMIGFFATRVTTNILFPSSPWILIVEIGLAMGIMVLYLLRYQSIHPKISSATNGPPIGIAMMRKHPRTSLASKQ